MKINTLELTNVRGFTHAKLEFQPGFNLIVGINGVGKTTVLESLRIVLSHILSEIKVPVVTEENFKKSDININTNQLQVNTNFSIDNVDYEFIYSKSAKEVYFKEVESNTSQNKDLRRKIEAQKTDLAQLVVDQKKYEDALNIKNLINHLVVNKIIKKVNFSNLKETIINLKHSELKKIAPNNGSEIREVFELLQFVTEDELSANLQILNDNPDIENTLAFTKEEINKLAGKENTSSTIPFRVEGIQQEDIIDFKTPINRKEKNNLLGIYFSTRRSLMVNQTSKVIKSKLFHAAAYVDTLSEVRSFNIKMFAEWFNVRKTLASENSKNVNYNRVIKLIEETIYTFIPAFTDLNLVKDKISNELTFSIVKEGKKLLFSQLSDGERGVLALVFDIARRLIIANNDAENPLEGQAIILIDELDLHLHPKWQRTIVSDLVRTFPNCQFIATTHSPQIISSVLPEKINIIKNFEVDQTVKSYGLDMNYILKFIMEDDDRLDIANQAIEAVEELINDIEFEKARDLIAKYKADNLDLSEWVDLEARMSHLEMFGDEEDN
ncbi:AAA family ATPase [Kaistella yonginensis]|uniref:AAA family ATPase n=1 Tax=Kaistella yonginensis TaxID=658267 RepID=UPI0025B482B6|nr:AAA family ATPase [Kaistella yonginensis]MDN3605852.1 AAA family ATPase [Kaistella yonginensis]